MRTDHLTPPPPPDPHLPESLCIQPIVTHVCIVLSDFLDVPFASCSSKATFSLLYDDIDLLLAVIVLKSKWVNLVKFEYMFWT